MIEIRKSCINQIDNTNVSTNNNKSQSNANSNSHIKSNR